MRKKLQQLEKFVTQKKHEEDELGKNFFGSSATTISSVGTSGAAPNQKEYSAEELERLRDALKDSLIV